jgi:hypothetical protein
LPHNFKTKQNMKKIIFAAAALFAFGFANAQDATEDASGGGFANGDVFITGSVGFTSQSMGDFKSNSFNITPMVGFMVSDNIAIGGMLGYASSTADVDDPDFGTVEFKTNAFSVGAFGRYYATPSSDFSFFGQASVAYISMTSEFDVAGSEELKTTGFGIEVAPGISYFLSDNWAIEATIGALSYNTMKPDFEGAESTDTFGLNLNLQDVNVGVIYKF